MAASAKKMKQELRLKTKLEPRERSPSQVRRDRMTDGLTKEEAARLARGLLAQAVRVNDAVEGLLAPAVADAAEAGSEADTDESEAIEETRKFFDEVTLWTFMDG